MSRVTLHTLETAPSAAKPFCEFARHNTAALLITHDIDEALLLSDRVVLLGHSPAHTVGEWRIDLAPPREERIDERGALCIDILKTPRRPSLIVSPDMTEVKQLGGQSIAIPFWYSIHNVVVQQLFRDNGLQPVTRSLWWLGVELFGSAQLYQNVRVSLKRILVSLLMALLIGVPLGLSIGILWIVLVLCEMLGVSAGLGYFILDTRDRLAYSELMAMMVLIGVLGFALDACARALHRRWVRA